MSEPTWQEIREAIDRYEALGDWITQAISRKQATCEPLDVSTASSGNRRIVQGLRSGGGDDEAAGSASGSAVCDPPPEAA